MDKEPNYLRIQSIFIALINDLNRVYDIFKNCVSHYGKDNEKTIIEYMGYLDDMYIKIKEDCKKYIIGEKKEFMVAADDFYNSRWKDFRSLLRGEYIYYQDIWYKVFSRHYNLHNDLREYIIYEPLTISKVKGLGFLNVDTFARYFDKIKVIKLYEFKKIDIVEKYDYWRKRNRCKIAINKFKTYKKLKK